MAFRARRAERLLRQRGSAEGIPERSGVRDTRVASPRPGLGEMPDLPTGQRTERKTPSPHVRSERNSDDDLKGYFIFCYWPSVDGQ
jgi:hypothetical protein